MNVLKLSGELRDSFGKQVAKNLRREELVPCVMYGGEKLTHFVVKKSDIKSVVYTSEFNMVEVEVDGKTYKTIVKDVQFHPVSEVVEHIDFQELVTGRKVKVSIPVKLVGDALGVKEGGSLVTVLRKIQIKTTPENLVAELEGDISGLNLKQSISIRDMVIPEGVEVLEDAGSPVGYIEVPRSLKSLESTAELEEGEEEGAEEGTAEEGTKEEEKAAE